MALTREMLGRLMDLASQLVAQETGRGPREVRVRTEDSFVVMELAGVLTPMEKRLIDHGLVHLVHAQRDALCQVMADEWREIFRRECHLRVGEVLSETDGHNDRRIIKLRVIE